MHTNTQKAHDPSTLKSKSIDWKALVFEWQSSGLSVSEFCRKYKVPKHQIHYYRKKYLSSSEASASMQTQLSGSRFAQVALSTSSSSNELRISLPNGVVVSGFSDAAFVLNFLKALP